jgi:hypothetical protein
MKMLHTLIGAALIAGSSAVSAGGPVALNDTELDGVTAGANVLISSSAFAQAFAQAIEVSATLTETDSNADVTATGLLTHDAFGASFARASSVSD